MAKRSASKNFAAINSTPYRVMNTNNTGISANKLHIQVMPAMSELGYQEYRLLDFYMNIGSDFAPSASYVHDMIGLGDANMRRARASLKEKDYIIVNDSARTITVNWNQLLKASRAISIMRTCADDIRDDTGETVSKVFAGGTIYKRNPLEKMTLREVDQIINSVSNPIAEDPYAPKKEGKGNARMADLMMNMTVGEYANMLEITRSHLFADEYPEPITTERTMYDIIERYEENEEEQELFSKLLGMGGYLDLTPYESIEGIKPSDDEVPLPF